MKGEDIQIVSQAKTKTGRVASDYFIHSFHNHSRHFFSVGNAASNRIFRACSSICGDYHDIEPLPMCCSYSSGKNSGTKSGDIEIDIDKSLLDALKDVVVARQRRT